MPKAGLSSDNDDGDAHQDTLPLPGASKLALDRNYLSARDVNGDDSTTQERVPASAQVVIVGAGLAGLAAAQRLHETGVADVVLLDAQDRVGGRVHTIEHGEYLLELGAQWLHGAQDNSLHAWLASLRMLDDFEEASTGFRGTFCTSSRVGTSTGRGGGGGEPIEPALVERVLAVLNESKSNLFGGGGGGERELPPQDTTITTTASQVFRRHLEASMARDPELAAQAHLVGSLFDWFLRYETIENGCDHMDEVSVQSYTDWSDLGEGTLLNFVHGYQSLLDWFCEHFPRRHWLRLNKQVLNVELLASSDGRRDKRSHPLIVKYKDLTSGQLATLECQHVIVTVSLGVLKRHSRTMFTPSLPPGKQTLVDTIGFGTVNKIVLQFEEPFWAASGGGIKLVWRDADFESPGQGQQWQDDEAPAAATAGGQFPAWARDILAFDVVRRQPDLLIGWIGGQGAKQMERASDEQVASVCLRVLERFLPRGHARPSRLLSCLCSRWHTNPFTCGSYSFQSMRSLGLDVDQLHEPIYDTEDEEAATGMTNGTNHTPGIKLSSDGKNNNNNTSCEKHNKNKNQLCDSAPAPPQPRPEPERVPRIMFAGEATAGRLYSTTHGAVISGWREADRLAGHLGAATCEPNGHVKSSTRPVPLCNSKSHLSQSIG